MRISIKNYLAEEINIYFHKQSREGEMQFLNPLEIIQNTATTCIVNIIGPILDIVLSTPVRNFSMGDI